MCWTEVNHARYWHVERSVVVSVDHVSIVNKETMHRSGCNTTLHNKEHYFLWNKNLALFNSIHTVAFKKKLFIKNNCN